MSDAPGTTSASTGGGGPRLSPATCYATPDFYTSPVVADFNGDGARDIAVAFPNTGQVGLLLGHGDGTFEPVRLWRPPISATPLFDLMLLDTADFNHDGRPDLVVLTHERSGSYRDTHIGVYLGLGDGSFDSGQETIPPSRPYALAAADLDRDGLTDLVLSSGSWSAFDVLFGDPDGGFAFVQGPPYANSSGYEAPEVVVADVNLDGQPDVLLAMDTSSSYTTGLALAQGGRSYAPTELISGWNDSGQAEFGVEVAAADLNGDRIPDLVLANFGCTSALLGYGDGGFAPATCITSDLGGGNLFALGDFRQSGIQDVALTAWDSLSVYLYTGDGAGHFQRASSAKLSDTHTVSLSALVAADFNGDGRLDLVVGLANRPAVGVVLQE